MMKKLAVIFVLFLASACTVGQTLEVTREPDPVPTVTEAPSIVLDWDREPEALIIQIAASGGGSAPNAALVNELFAAQVWGDGRIVWTTWSEDYQRQVWQGQLSEAEMTTLLETFVDKGFFRMKARYAPAENVFDGGTTRLSVHLLSTEHAVSEYVSGAPDRFHELVALLLSGAGVEAMPYLPETGRLTAREINPQNRTDEAELPQWDAAVLGLDLHDAASIWIEGEALLSAWEVVNRSPAFPIVVQGDSYFELHLRLPEIGVMATQ